VKGLDPKKLTTIFNCVTPINPIIPRKYTLTHSDVTAELFLAVGLKFAYETIGPMRDEVLAKWRPYQNGYTLYGLVHADSQNGNKAESAVRYKIFQENLPLALEAIRYGDRKFFHTHPPLDEAPIYIKFSSVFPEYNGVQYWGTPSQYVTK